VDVFVSNEACRMLLRTTLMWLLLCVCCCSLFKSLVPLWGRQIPYTMMKFGKHNSWK
jgi:hypothetical protein